MWPKYEKPFFFYVRKYQPAANGVTVCFIPTEDGFAPGVAICSEKDNFCKKTGRNVALGRAEISSVTKKFVNASNYDELSNKATELARRAMEIKESNYRNANKVSLL